MWSCTSTTSRHQDSHTPCGSAAPSPLLLQPKATPRTGPRDDDATVRYARGTHDEPGGIDAVKRGVSRILGPRGRQVGARKGDGMGRQSRMKRSRRALGQPGRWEAKRGMLQGLDAQRRGEHVGPGLDDYERAFSEGGHELVQERLLANHNLRMIGCAKLPADYTSECWEGLRRVPILYLGLDALGADMDLHVAAMVGGWPDHLRWGVDSVQQAVRLLLAGQVLGAALVARSQLERWTWNRYFARNLAERKNEGFEAFVARVWGPSAFGDGAHPIGARAFSNAAEVTRNLVEIIHAGAERGGTVWTSQGFDGDATSATADAQIVVAALEMVTDQLAQCIANELAERGSSRRAATIAQSRFVGPKFSARMPPHTIWPANLLLIQGNVTGRVHAFGTQFRSALEGSLSTASRPTDPELIVSCFTYFRSRCIRDSTNAFNAEAEVVGPLTQANLAGMEQPVVITSEMAAAAARWLPALTPVSAACAAISDSLRTAYWLWLEDDSRAMAALRVALEQLARLRVWREKPSQGAKLEAYSSPIRWLEKAGLKRLAALNRALGELTHFRPDVHWGAALNLLTSLNLGFEESEAPFTARRHALETVTRLASLEVRATVRTVSPEVASAFDLIADQNAVGGVKIDVLLADFMQHSHALRDVAFPDESEWVRVADLTEEELRLVKSGGAARHTQPRGRRAVPSSPPDPQS